MPPHKTPSSSASKRSNLSLPKPIKPEPTETMNDPDEAQQDPKHSLVKRNNSPGVRVIHGRIYDSENGTCCHQCRQKTRDFSVQCKNQAEDKQCRCYFCHSCLLNRYGEKAEELAALDDWKCPKCRGICNCSYCRKKQGCCPVGSLLRVARARGFASVFEMLQSKDYKEDFSVVLAEKHRKENGSNGKRSSKLKCKSKGNDDKDGLIGAKRVTKDNVRKKDGISRTKRVAKDNSDENLVSSKKFQQDLATYSTGGCKRGTILDGDTRRELNFEVVQLVKKMETGELRNGESIGNFLERNEVNSSCEEKSDLQKCHISEEKHITTENEYIQCDGESKKRKPDMTGPKENCNKKIKTENDEMVNIVSSENKIEEKACDKDDCGQLEKKNMKDPEEKCYKKEIKEENEAIAINQSDYDVKMDMPQGIELTKVAKIDFASEDIGDALQFLEFCDAFGKVLDIKKGQPESLLQELASGQCSFRVGDSSIIGFHIKLLSMIQNNFGEEYYSLDSDCTTTWLRALSRYISDSHYQPKELLLEQNDLVCKKYGELSSSKKLRLLTFLCDEALGSVELRNWMDEKNSAYEEEERKGKESGKKKEKEVKMKLQNELARAALVNNGAPLSVSEHHYLVSKIKAEAAHALADLGIKKNQKPEAIRLEPMLLDGSGRKFWKLQGYSDEPILVLQECIDNGGGDAVSFSERWFSYKVEDLAILEKYILGRLRK